MYDIAITDRQRLLSLDLALLRDVVEGTLSDEGVATARIGLALIDDREIHRINREYLNHDYPTDVISFLLCESREEGREPPDPERRGRGKSLEGEIAVSTETALASATELDWNPHDEVVLYVVHGLLHLAGYDDLSPDERRLMRRRERSILSRWGMAPPDDPMEHMPPAGDSDRTTTLPSSREPS